MSAQPRVMSSLYLEWAKLHAGARYNLAASGIMSFPLAELPVSIEDLEINGPGGYGFVPLQEAIASKYSVDPDRVVAATGTSMANHLAMAACLSPGDEVLIEHPTYEALISAALYLGAQVKRFPRRFDEGFRVDAGAVESAISANTRLVVITNLHNPSGVLTDNETLQQVGEIAKKVGARVLVDEVYLETMFDQKPNSAHHLGDHFVVTSSLTKAYGLSGLRCGWILAEPDLTKRIWRLNDLFGVIPAHVAELLSVTAFTHLDHIACRAKTLLEKNRILLNRFLDQQAERLDVVRTECGTVTFPRPKRGSVEKLCVLLREKYETSIVPGRFFEMPEHFRMGVGGETEMIAEGLRRLGLALEEL